MASPFGHILIGTGIGFGLPRRNPHWGWLTFAAFAACTPDLDFLPGLMVGDINRYHQLASHSFSAMLLFGIAIGMLGRSLGRNGWRVGVGAAVLYGSHLAVDVFTHDIRPPYGIPLFWPFYDEHIMAPWTPFGGIRHGVPGDPLSVFLRNIFSWHNLAPLAIELFVLGPIALLAAWIGWYRRAA